MLNDEELRWALYNATDTIVTSEAWEGFKHELDDIGYRGPYEQTMALYPVLMAMMARGIRVDSEQLINTRGELEEQKRTKQEELNELVEFELNVDSPKQCIEYFYGKKGVTPYKSVKTGNPTVDDRALTRMARGTSARPAIPEARLVQDIRGLGKLIGTYLSIEFDPDGRLRCSYNPRGTKFGRLSSSKTPYGTGMNLQNLPDAFKKFLVPDEGYIFWELDKKGAEWVIVAFASGDPNMLKVFYEELDPHVHTAHLMTGIDKEVIELENKYVGHITDQNEIGRLRNELRKDDSAAAAELDRARFIPRSMSMRQCGKRSNHGLNYGETYKMFSLVNEMPENEAKVIVDMYSQEVYPGIPQYWSKVQDKLSRDRTLENCFGRKCRLLGEWGNDLFKSGYSFEPQSTVVDIINRGLIEVYHDTEGFMEQQELLAQIHDSVMGQAPDTDERGLAESLVKIGEHMNPELEINGRTFRIPNELKISTTNWADMKEVPYTTNIEELAESVRGIAEFE